MKQRRSMAIASALFLIALVAGLAAPRVKADSWNQKTIFTFSGPVEIPGRVLPRGTYVFKLVDLEADRDVVQVFSKDERTLYGTFLAIPDLRMKPTGKAVITFAERPAGNPVAVKAWFYPGDVYGHEFVYPKKKAVELAKANNAPVPSMPDELASQTTAPAETANDQNVAALKQVPLKAEQPSEQEVEITEVFASPGPDSLPRQLPRTGSSLPLVALIGLLSLTTALGLRLAVARNR